MVLGVATPNQCSFISLYLMEFLPENQVKNTTLKLDQKFCLKWRRKQEKLEKVMILKECLNLGKKLESLQHSLKSASKPSSVFYMRM